MPNIYFYQPTANNLGILRAVLSWEECKRVLEHHSATYAGERFPIGSTLGDMGQDYGILAVGADEASKTWRSGFYRFDGDITQINEVLLRLAK